MENVSRACVRSPTERQVVDAESMQSTSICGTVSKGHGPCSQLDSSDGTMPDTTNTWTFAFAGMWPVTTQSIPVHTYTSPLLAIYICCVQLSPVLIRCRCIDTDTDTDTHRINPRLYAAPHHTTPDEPPSPRTPRTALPRAQRQRPVRPPQLGRAPLTSRREPALPHPPDALRVVGDVQRREGAWRRGGENEKV